ncbi:ORFL219C [Human betaherpesvirus 5]|nr:ORFL219C [Human betaherpesvirus 5]QHX40577.1 ORFL219C [Human betaherpesvirus 5]
MLTSSSAASSMGSNRWLRATG